MINKLCAEAERQKELKMAIHYEQDGVTATVPYSGIKKVWGLLDGEATISPEKAMAYAIKLHAVMMRNKK